MRKCIQKTKSLDSTIDYEKEWCKRGNRRVIHGKVVCHSCYFGFEKQGSKDRLYWNYERQAEDDYNCDSKDEDVLESGFCKFHDENYLQDENNHKEFVDRPTSKVIRGAIMEFIIDIGKSYGSTATDSNCSCGGIVTGTTPRRGSVGLMRRRG